MQLLQLCRCIEQCLTCTCSGKYTTCRCYACCLVRCLHVSCAWSHLSSFHYLAHMQLCWYTLYHVFFTLANSVLQWPGWAFKPSPEDVARAGHTLCHCSCQWGMQHRLPGGSAPAECGSDQGNACFGCAGPSENSEASFITLADWMMQDHFDVC